MKKYQYSTWILEAGLPFAPDILDLDNKKLLQFNNQAKQKIGELARSDSRIESIYLEYFRETHSDIAAQTPLALFVNRPQVFFETFWPFVRKSVGRQYHILKFMTPLQTVFTHECELAIRNSEPAPEMLYFGCLRQRVPIMKAEIENQRVSIIPYELLVTRINSFLTNTEEWAYLNGMVSDAREQLIDLIRRQVTLCKPVFLEYTGSKYLNESMIIVSLECQGSVLRSETQIAKKRQLFSRLFTNVTSLFSVFFDEPTISIKIFPKSAIVQCWIYVYAPQGYHLKEDKIEKVNHDNVVDSTSINPELLSYRFGRKNNNDQLNELSISTKICIPRPQKLWINMIDKLLLAFVTIWLLADLSFLGKLFGSLEFVLLNIFQRIATYSGVLTTTFVLVSFIFVARNWFLHESEIYKPASYRFAIILSILTFLSLLYVVVNNIS